MLHAALIAPTNYIPDVDLSYTFPDPLHPTRLNPRTTINSLGFSETSARSNRKASNKYTTYDTQA